MQRTTGAKELSKKIERRLQNLGEQTGTHLAGLRKSQGLSMTDLARTAGVARRHISRIERGIQPPRVRTILKILAGVAGRDAVVNLPILASRVRLARKKLLMTQFEFADLVGIRRDQVADYEDGSVVPGLDVLRRMAGWLWVGLDFFCGDTEWAS